MCALLLGAGCGPESAQGPAEATDAGDPGNLGEATSVEALENAGLGPTLNLSEAPGADVGPSISRSDGVVMVAWTEETGGGFETMFRRGNGKTFDDKMSLGPSVSGARVQVLARGQNAYVVWGGPSGLVFRASHDRGRSFGPEVVLNATGGRPFLAAAGDNVYVAWTFDEELFFRASHDEGESFDPELFFAGLAGSAALAAAGDRVYLAWDQADRSNSDILFRRSENEGRSFRPRQFLSDDPTLHSRTPQLAAVGDRVFAIWADCDRDLQRECQIKFRRSTDGGDDFSRERNLSEDEDTTARFPVIAIAGQRVNVAWLGFALVPEGTTGVFFRRSTNSGRSFEGKLTLSPSPFSTRFSMAADGSRAHVVWREDGEVFGRTVKKGRAGPRVNVSDNAGLSDDGVVAADDGQIDIAWRDGTPGNTEIFYRHGEDVIEP